MMNFEKIRTLYALPDDRNEGFEETAIAALEKRLACRLPATLRNYYLSLGKDENLNYVHNRLLKPEKETGFSRDRYLVFYEENQVVAYWGIREQDLHLDDPPVYGNYAVNNEAPDWQMEASTTSNFLLLMAIYNGTFGGLTYHAHSFEPIEKETLNYIKTKWEEVSEVSFERQKIYTDNFSEVISISFDDEEKATGIFIGTSDQKRFDLLLDLPGISWSYTAYEDCDEEDEEQK